MLSFFSWLTLNMDSTQKESKGHVEAGAGKGPSSAESPSLRAQAAPRCACLVIHTPPSNSLGDVMQQKNPFTQKYIPMAADVRFVCITCSAIKCHLFG